MLQNLLSGIKPKRRMHEHVLILWTILVLTSILLASCGGAATPETQMTEQPQTGVGEKTKIVIWIHAAEPFIQAHNEIKDLYQAENPNVEIEIQSFPWGDFSTKIASSLAAGTGPDLLEAYSPWMMLAIRTSQVDEVPASFGTVDEIRNRFYESTLALVEYDGKVFGIPSNLGADQTRVLYVNDDIVNEAGVNINDNETFEDWIEDWQALTVVDQNGTMTRSGLGVACKQPPYQFASYLMEYGGSVLTDDGKQAALNSEPGRKALQLMGDFVHNYKVDSPFLTDLSCVGNGTAASSYQGTWFVPVLKADYPDMNGHFVVLPFPTGATNEVWHGGSGWASYVPAASKNKEAAWAYLDFIEENREKWLEYTSEMSAQKDLAAELANKNPDLYGVYYPILEQSKHGWPYGDFFVIYDAMQAMVMSVWLEEATVDQALQTAEETINTHLDQWWAQYGE